MIIVSDLDEPLADKNWHTLLHLQLHEPDQGAVKLHLPRCALEANIMSFPVRRVRIFDEQAMVAPGIELLVDGMHDRTKYLLI